MQPPGIDILHLPNLASIGPTIKNDALIRFIKSLLGSISFKFEVSIIKSPVISENSTEHSNSLNKFTNTRTSSSKGTFFIVIFLGFKIVATIIGKTEFFAILISTSP